MPSRALESSTKVNTIAVGRSAGKFWSFLRMHHRQALTKEVSVAGILSTRGHLVISYSTSANAFKQLSRLELLTPLHAVLEAVTLTHASCFPGVHLLGDADAPFKVAVLRIS